MKKSTIFLIAVLSFFIGILNGFIFAPVKNGIKINMSFNYNKNNRKKDKNNDIEKISENTDNNAGKDIIG